MALPLTSPGNPKEPCGGTPCRHVAATPPQRSADNRVEPAANIRAVVGFTCSLYGGKSHVPRRFSRSTRSPQHRPQSHVLEARRSSVRIFHYPREVRFSLRQRKEQTNTGTMANRSRVLDCSWPNAVVELELLLHRSCPRNRSESRSYRISSSPERASARRKQHSQEQARGFRLREESRRSGR